MTSHKWGELVSSGRLICRCHDVFLWCYVCFVLLRFRVYAFVEAAALRSIVLRYTRPDSHTCFFLSFFSFIIWRCRVFRVFFVPSPFSLCMESTSYVFAFRMVFFYLVTTGWIFDISLCENSTNQKYTERGQGNIHFPCSADHEQDWQPYPVDPYSCYICDHTYIHNLLFMKNLNASKPSEHPPQVEECLKV